MAGRPFTAARTAAALIGAVVLPAVGVLAPAAPATAAPVCARVPGDFNGDGRADLAVGAPGRPFQDGGTVRVIPGEVNGLLTTRPGREVLVSAGRLGSPAGPAPSNVGVALAPGYFDGDCFADLAVGAYDDTVWVFSGSATGLSRTRFTAIDTSDVSADIWGERGFGYRLATGDFDHDGVDDLAVGHPFALNRAGGVAILYGRTTGGLSATGAAWLTPGVGGVPGAPQTRSSFGLGLAAGDFDGDGFADLAAGAPGRDAGADRAGAVLVLNGSRAGITTAGARWWDQSGDVPGVPEAGDEFGTVLAAGDLTGDGRAELVVGSPKEKVGTVAGGWVTVLPGSPAGLVAAGSVGYAQGAGGVPGVVLDGAQFGAAIAIGDLDADGFPDLTIGAPGYRSVGLVAVLPGSAAGVRPAGSISYDQGSVGVPGDPAAGNAFGAALRVIPGAGRVAYLAVGAAGHVTGEADLKGSLTVLRSSGTHRMWAPGMPQPEQELVTDSTAFGSALG
jgi:hypothetical protein